MFNINSLRRVAFRSIIFANLPNLLRKIESRDNTKDGPEIDLAKIRNPKFRIRNPKFFRN